MSRSCPYLVVNHFEGKELRGTADDVINAELWDQLQLLPFVVGSFLTAVFLAKLMLALIEKRYKRTNKSMDATLLASNTRGEYRLKLSASRKINGMLDSAMALHETNDPGSKSPSLHRGSNSRLRSSALSKGQSSEPDRTMLNYVLRGETQRVEGGVIWAWKLLLSGKLFESEGIWIPTRMIVFQGAQVVLAAFTGWIFVFISKFAADQAADADESIDPDWPEWVKE